MAKSFLQKLLDTYKNYEPLSVGKESIFVDIKDLYKNAFYNYITLRFDNFEKGKNMLNKYGIDYKESLHIYKEKNDTYSLKITFKDKEKIIQNIDSIFEDKEGKYNKKGYYDEDAVKKFNMMIFQVFDEIMSIEK